LYAKALGVIAHTIEQHGLADAAQADDQDAFRGQPQAHTLDGDTHCFSERITARKLGRLTSRAGSKGVSDRIHDAIIGSLFNLAIFNKLHKHHQTPRHRVCCGAHKR
jgi:hypothetical protein